MTWILALLARWGVPESVRRPLLIVTAIIAALALLAVLKGCYDRGVVERHDDAVNLEAEKGARGADAKAADQRASDAATNREESDDYAKAISSAAPSAPDDAHRRLACERLRRAGQDPAAIPACR